MMRRVPLKQGKPLQRKKAMSRGSGFSRAGTKTPATGAGLLRVVAARVRETKTPKARSTLKSSRPKMTPIRSSARGQDCTVRAPSVCNRNPETTVWAHSNRLEDGKGMGIKARDEEGCYACSDCHAWLDGGYAGRVPREVVDARFDAARAESQEQLRALGLMSDQDNEKEAA